MVAHALRRDRADRAQHLHLLVAQGIGVEYRRRLHRHQRQQLHQVILQHVAHGAGGVVVAGAPAHALRLGHGDLHVVDVVAVPDRLDQGVGEAEHQQVLHRFLAEVMIDAVNLVLVEIVVQLCVQRARWRCPRRRVFPPRCGAGRGCG
jgi:hypothetical protein